VGGSVVAPLLGLRALNRATLERQLLLRRAELGVPRAIERLAGLQAQAPNSPYLALWARVEGFRLEQLTRAILQRRVVRAATMRSTLHLVTARDFLAWRAALQPVLTRVLMASHGRQLQGIDLEDLRSAGLTLLRDRPHTQAELGARLAAQWPRHAPAALGVALRCLSPLVHVPPAGTWDAHPAPALADAEQWLEAPLAAAGPLDVFVTRYLAAFGPASVRDMQTWTGLTGLREIAEQLPLRRFVDVDGTPLYDLPRAPRPDADTPAPVRLVPEFDNLLLSHADRRRVIDEAYRPAVYTANGIIRATVLIDGFVRGVWRLDRKEEHATVGVEPLSPWSATQRRAVRDEAQRLLDFVAPGARHDIVFARS
jgi:hypothetical protein